MMLEEGFELEIAFIMPVYTIIMPAYVYDIAAILHKFFFFFLTPLNVFMCLLVS